EDVRDRVIAAERLKAVRGDELLEGFRRSAHRGVDLAFDVAGTFMTAAGDAVDAFAKAPRNAAIKASPAQYLGGEPGSSGGRGIIGDDREVDRHRCILAERDLQPVETWRRVGGDVDEDRQLFEVARLDVQKLRKEPHGSRRALSAVRARPAGDCGRQ